MDSNTAAAAIAAAVLGSYVYFVVKPRREAVKPFDDLPMPPNSHWFFGHLGVMQLSLERMKQIYVDQSNEQGRIAFWVIKKPFFATIAWQDARSILLAEYHRETAPIAGRHFLRILGPNNMLLTRHKEWRFHRSAIAKAMTSAAVQGCQAAIRTVVETVTESLRDNINNNNNEYTIKMEELCKMITLDIFGLSFFSRSFDCCDDLKPSEIAEAFALLQHEMVKRLLDPFRLDHFYYGIPTKANREWSKANHTVRSFLTRAINERLQDDDNEKATANRAISNGDNDAKRNLLKVLIDVQKATMAAEDWADLQVTKISQHDALSDVVMSLLFAGYDTTSLALCYTFYSLSQHPHVEQLCLQEIEAVGDDNWEELIYCKGVLLEALRLYPPAPFTNRTLQRNVKLRDGYVIPAGTQVMIPIWFVHRNEANFARACEFLPERWVKRDGTGRWVERNYHDQEQKDSSADIPVANIKALLTFSAGSRSCVGQSFAWQEMLLILSTMLPNFTFSALPDYELKPTRAGLVQKPHDGMPMIVRLRK